MCLTLQYQALCWPTSFLHFRDNTQLRGVVVGLEQIATKPAINVAAFGADILSFAMSCLDLIFDYNSNAMVDDKTCF